MTVPRRLGRAVDTAPGHDDRALLGAAFEDLVPADDPPALGRQMGGDAVDEPALQLVLVFKPQRLHLRLDLRTGLPLVLDRLVAADVNVRGGEDVDHLVQHRLQEGEGRVVDVVEVGEHAPVRHARLRDLPGDAQLWIGGDRRGGMAGQLYLGHDHDVASGRIGDDLARLRLGIEAAIGFVLRGRGAIGVRTLGLTPGADAGQLRIGLDLQPPALVVVQVPVEDVQLVGRHGVDQPLDLVHGLEVPGAVQHEAAPGVARGVLDADEGQGGAVGGQLPDGDRAIEQALAVARGDLDARGPDIDGVLLARAGRTLQDDRAGGCGDAFDDRQLGLAGPDEHVAQLQRHDLGFCVASGDMDPCRGGQAERAVLGGDLGWPRRQGWCGGRKDRRSQPRGRRKRQKQGPRGVGSRHVGVLLAIFAIMFVSVTTSRGCSGREGRGHLPLTPWSLELG